INIVFIYNNGESLKISVKSSTKKRDYFYNGGGGKYLFGNAIKHVEVDLKTGLIKADFLVFAADVRDYFGTESVKDMEEIKDNLCKNPENDFSYWIFSRDDLSTLYPKASIFIPSYVYTLMIEWLKYKKSAHPTDGYTTFKKGVYQIILPKYENEDWTDEYPEGFSDTWCPLINNEHMHLQKIMPEL
ncbi:MAG: hypothetical protein ACUVWP_08645, partial [bacterium]